MKQITILLKPTEECNFRCKYCYHADSNYEKGRMSIEFFEEIIKKSFSKYNDIEFTFHGGESLLMGIDWFKKAFDIIKKYKNNIHLGLSIQTNASMLNEEFLELFQANDVNIGVSFDGPGDLNGLRDCTDEVTDNIVKSGRKGYKLGLLGVVTQKNLHGFRTFYEFAKENNCSLMLNPVFQSGGAKENNDYLISATEFISELKNLFPVWFEDENAIALNPLLNLSAMAIIGHGLFCSTCGCLTRWISIDHNGRLFPCSRSYPDKYCLGNIRDFEELSQVFEHEKFRSLLYGAIERRDYCKKTCDYYSICQGGCNNDAILNGDLTRPASFRCEVYKTMIPYIRNYIEKHNSIKNRYIIKIMERGYLGKHNDK